MGVSLDEAPSPTRVVRACAAPFSSRSRVVEGKVAWEALPATAAFSLLFCCGPVCAPCVVGVGVGAVGVGVGAVGVGVSDDPRPSRCASGPFPFSVPAREGGGGGVGVGGVLGGGGGRAEEN